MPVKFFGNSPFNNCIVSLSQPYSSIITCRDCGHEEKAGPGEYVGEIKCPKCQSNHITITPESDGVK